MKKRRYLAVGAHPDDMDIRMGGTLAKLCRAGHEVRVLCLVNGNAGHYAETPENLAARRRDEADRARELTGLAAYDIWDIPDGYLEPTMENRLRLIRDIRGFAPDVLFSLRTVDYHPDHRAAAQLVQDASYLLTVPLYCPESKHLSEVPVILSVYDEFSNPVPFRPDIGVVIDDISDVKLRMLACHESQVFEWLPYNRNDLGIVPQNEAERLQWLQAILMKQNLIQADQFRPLLSARYGDLAQGAVFAETFELSEYGRRPDNITEELNRLLPL